MGGARLSKPSKLAAGHDAHRAEEAAADPVARADAAVLSLRIDLDFGRRIGPGKIELLERIAADGSISAAARQMRMSYLRAWRLVDELDAMFGKAVVRRKVGGTRGGFTHLTPLGRVLVARFRAVEREAADLAQSHFAALQVEIERLDDDPAGVAS